MDRIVSENVEALIRDNPISYDDLQSLLEYAADVCNFVTRALNNSTSIITVTNHDDWLNTLETVKIGEEYRKEYNMHKYEY